MWMHVCLVSQPAEPGRREEGQGGGGSGRRVREEEGGGSGRRTEEGQVREEGQVGNRRSSSN